MTFSPQQITGSGSSILTLAAAPNLAQGTYNLSLSGTADNLAHTTAITMNVNSTRGDFTVALPADPSEVNPGGSEAIPANVAALNGFADVVNFGVTGLPDGRSSFFAPPTVRGLGSTNLNVRTDAGTAAGTYGITVNGTSGTLTRSANSTLVVILPGGQAPTADSVSPAGGSGQTQTFLSLARTRRAMPM
ncbi:MAG: hypothetical protein IT167_12705 [Bryobacterales bacterium]|nr:hypothetical protein [Bryobacterales bacterium]